MTVAVTAPAGPVQLELQVEALGCQSTTSSTALQVQLPVYSLCGIQVGLSSSCTSSTSTVVQLLVPLVVALELHSSSSQEGY